MYDGGNNVGMLALYHATRAAIAKAAAHGFAVAGVTNSWMSGRSAYYCEMIAKADLVGIHTASSSRSVAPFGGARPALGTNPIAFGMPSADGPVVLDMGTSAFMGTEMALRERLGQLLPEGVAIDPAGRADPRPGGGAAGRAAAVRRVQGLWARRLSSRRWACSPARAWIPTRTTAICLLCSSPTCWCRSTSSSARSAR